HVVPTGEHVTSGRVVVVVVGTTVVVVETGHCPGPGQHVASPVGPTQRHSWTHLPSRQASRVHGLPSSHPEGHAHAATHASKPAAQVAAPCCAVAAHPRRHASRSAAVPQPRTHVLACATTSRAQAASVWPHPSRKAPVHEPGGGGGEQDPRQSA